MDGYRNLDGRTREIYCENVRLSEALSLHAGRVEELEKKTKSLETTNRLIILINFTGII